jgi:hypothetical protein
MQIYQSRLTGVLFIACEIYRSSNQIEVSTAESYWVSSGVEWYNLGVLLEDETGYAGIIKSFDVLANGDFEFIGEL